MASVGALLFAAGMLALMGTIGYQILLYLKHGMWVALSVTYVCGSPPFEWQWCNFPEDWLGVHKMLSWFNAGGFAALIGVVVLWAGVLAEDGAK